MKQSPLWLLLAFCSLLVACFNPDSYPPEPAITAISIDPTSIANLTGSFKINIQFQDGDGNLGTTEQSPEANVFVIDKRDGFVTNYSFADISGGGEQGVSGTIDISVSSECCRVISGIPCTPQASYPPTDTVRYEVVLKDRAGNLSNIALTPVLLINCQ